MEFFDVILLLFAAIGIANLIVIQFRRPAMPLVNFFAAIVCIVILTTITFTEITFEWYVTIVFVISLTLGAVVMNRK